MDTITPNPPAEAPETTPAEPIAAPKVFDRDAIRTAVLDSKPEITSVGVFGVEIEIRAPDLEGLLQYRGMQDDDTIMARQLINHCYVPGTDEAVFEEADVAALMKTKFSPDMKKLISAINKALGADEELVASVDQAAFRLTE